MTFDKFHDEKQKKIEICVLDIHSSKLTNVPYNVGMIDSMNIGERELAGKTFIWGVYSRRVEIVNSVVSVSKL